MIPKQYSFPFIKCRVFVMLCLKKLWLQETVATPLHDQCSTQAAAIILTFGEYEVETLLSEPLSNMQVPSSRHV